jgi:hypothetical protein
MTGLDGMSHDADRDIRREDARRADGKFGQQEHLEADVSLVEDEYLSLEDCIADETHLTSVDDDGYCDACGTQDGIEVVPGDVVPGDILRLDDGAEVLIASVDTYDNGMGGNGYRITASDGETFEYDYETYFAERIGFEEPGTSTEEDIPTGWMQRLQARYITRTGTTWEHNGERFTIAEIEGTDDHVLVTDINGVKRQIPPGAVLDQYEAPAEPPEGSRRDREEVQASLLLRLDDRE